MSPKIRKVAVLGAGVMGSGIAAHLANAGISCLMLDIVPPTLSDDEKKKGLTETSPAFRNRFALKGLEGIRKSRPSLIYSQKDLARIAIGNFDDDFAKIAGSVSSPATISSSLMYRTGLKKCVTKKWRRNSFPRPSIICAIEIPEVLEETTTPGFQSASILA